MACKTIDNAFAICTNDDPLGVKVPSNDPELVTVTTGGAGGGWSPFTAAPIVIPACASAPSTALETELTFTENATHSPRTHLACPTHGGLQGLETLTLTQTPAAVEIVVALDEIGTDPGAAQ